MYIFSCSYLVTLGINIEISSQRTIRKEEYFYSISFNIPGFVCGSNIVMVNSQ